MIRARAIVSGLTSKNSAIVLCFAAFALFIGYYLPLVGPEFAAKVGSLLCVGIVFFSSTLFPDDALAPQRLIVKTLTVWLFCQTAVPIYLSVHVGVDWGPYRMSCWALMFLVVYWGFASRNYRDVLFERFNDAQWWGILMFVWFDWRLVCSLFTDIEIYSVQFLLKNIFFSYIIVLVVFATVRDRLTIKNMAMWISVGVIISCLIGLGEWRHHGNLFARFVQATDESGANQWIVDENMRDGAQRISSVFVHPLLFGEFLCMALPIAFCCWRQATSKWGRRIGLMACILAPSGIYLAHTRSAILVAGIGLMVYIALRALTRMGLYGMRLAIVLFFIGGMSAAVLGLGGNRVVSLIKGSTAAEAGSSYARVVMFQRGMVAVENSPIVGSGPGTSVYKIGQLQAGAGLTIDNQFLSEIIETGVPGFVLYFCVLTVPLLRVFRADIVPENQPWVCAFSASLIAYIAFRPVLSLTGNQDLAMFLIAMIYLLSGRTASGEPLIRAEVVAINGKA